jgi:RNA polymerase sigma-70 factor (ECF subfamily)
MQTTQELVEAAKAGESDAIAALVDRYQRAAITTAWAITRDFHEAQDISQECFVVAFRRLGSLNANAAFGRWLLISVRRACFRPHICRYSASCLLSVEKSCLTLNFY